MSEDGEGKGDVVLGDAAVEGPEAVIALTGEIIRTTDESVRAPVVTLDLAVEALIDTFGLLVDAEYLVGKTAFRDALCARFDVSQLEGEELVDALEAAGRIRFVESEEGVGFRIAHREQEP
jgi:hypothetical protein